jgi:anti-sigma factor RsiW
VSCDEARELVSGYLDGEFDLRTQAEIDRHLRGCAACAREFESQRAVHVAFSNTRLYFAAPARLRERLRSAIGPETKPAQTRMTRFSWPQLAVAGAFAVLLLAAGLSVLRPRHSSEQALANQILDSHLRSLMLNHLTDVASTDQHTVKPWFDGKLDYSPPVRDFEQLGFPLVGGRLDYIGHRNVAALVYQRRKHLINVFVWPSTSRADLQEGISQQQGYNFVHWRLGGNEWWAVSDLNANELEGFVRMLRSP